MKIHTIKALVIIGLISLNNFAQANLNDGLVAYYEFEGDANDSSGNGNHGTEHQGIAYLTGINGQAASFDGIDDYIRIRDDFHINSDMTISVWVRSRGQGGDGHSEGVASIISKYNWAGDESYNLHIRPDHPPGYVGFYIVGKISDSDVYTIEEGIFSDYSWLSNVFLPNGLIHEYDQHINTNLFSHIVIKVDNSLISIYINNKLISSVPRSTTSIGSNISEPVYLGNAFNFGDGNNNHFKGEIDSLRIYKRALFKYEIQELYNEGSAGNKEVQDSVAVLSEKLNIHIPQLLLYTNESNSSNLELNLKRISNEGESLTWKLEYYNTNICPRDVNQCSNDYQVSESSLNGIFGKEALNIYLPFIKYNKNTYWANLKYSGEPKGVHTWNLKDYGETKSKSEDEISKPNFKSNFYKNTKDKNGNYLKGYWYRGYAPKEFYDYSKGESTELFETCGKVKTYAKGNCTWYAKSRVRELGKSVSYDSWGDATTFDSSAKSAGYTVNETPTVGAIAQANAYRHGYTEYGHVAVVEKVNSDGTIDISESSYAPCSKTWNFLYRIRNVSAKEFDNYIHFD